jgi:hypothetical protein
MMTQAVDSFGTRLRDCDRDFTTIESRQSDEIHTRGVCLMNIKAHN